MDLFFGIASDDNSITLDETESNHLINVKRAKTGDLIQVTDGKGNLFSAELLNIQQRQCKLLVRTSEKTISTKFKLHIALAPTKNIDRMEWFLEKATETGIDEISFIICRHSERREIKTERLQRVLISSMKQSLKTFLPKMNQPKNFNNFIKEKNDSTKLLFSMDANKDQNLKKHYRAGSSLTALIGPEGDFHPEELKLAIENNFMLTSLGDQRLRTETAALSVCTLFNFINSQ